MALLIQYLVCFGAAAGRNIHYAVEATRHSLNEFAILVGPSGKGRKGSAWDHVEALVSELDQGFAARCISSGLSSGEGLIYEVRDPSDGDTGAQDKRRLIIESEFAQVLKVLAHEGNTLSPVVRNAWTESPCRRSPRPRRCARPARTWRSSVTSPRTSCCGSSRAPSWPTGSSIAFSSSGSGEARSCRSADASSARSSRACATRPWPRCGSPASPPALLRPASSGAVDRPLRPALPRRGRPARRRHPPCRSARRPPRRDLRHARHKRADRTGAPRSSARRLALQPRLRPLDLRRHPRRPDRR